MWVVRKSEALPIHIVSRAIFGVLQTMICFLIKISGHKNQRMEEKRERELFFSE